jgi:hypothetical protein
MAADASFSLNIYRKKPYHSIFGENQNRPVVNIYFVFASGFDIGNSVDKAE